MGLSDISAKLPPGFRFYPSDEELVCHYLYKKIIANNNEDALIKNTLEEIDLHICEPWQLPEVAKLNSSEWYFFSFRDRKYATGYRTNRATKTGYWKATGKDRTVADPNTGALVGMRKTLVFYKNRAPNGIKTGWIMHEFRLENPHIPPKEDWVLCRVFYKAKGDNSNEFKSQNNVTSPIYTDSNPLHMTDTQPPACDCYHQITTNTSHQSPLLHDHHDKFINNFHSVLPQLSHNSTSLHEESTNQKSIVRSNTKCQDHESGLFSDLGFDFSLPSPMEFGDDNNEEYGMVFF